MKLLTSLALTALFLIAAPFSFAQSPSAPSPAVANSATPGFEHLSLDRAWRFHLGDIPMPVISGHGASYSNAKAGKAWGAAAPDFDDNSWREVDLPHDWAVEGPFDPKANLSQGYRNRGIGWYRRYIRLDPADHGRALELQFDGIATHCTVWLNGTVVHRNWCGYTGFTVDMTPFATYGDQLNCIAIRVDADAQEGWWYEGAGIYRHTYLNKRNAVHLTTDGVWANPVKHDDGSWEIPVEATVRNDGTDSAKTDVSVDLIDPAGKTVAQGVTTIETTALDQTVAKISIPASNPSLWSLEAPTLYTINTSLKNSGTVIDSQTMHCGFRTIKFDPDKGFFLNDQPVKLKGTCNHQDHAGVGVAVPDSIWDFRVRRLKELGSNAFRCAHNPPAREFLDACDRQGLLVMDENRNFNASEDYIPQLEWLIRRDRSHPSVILWSVFNEEPMQGTEVGYELVRRMKAIVKRLDTTRPVTAAQSGGMGSPINVSQAVDVVGFNYQQGGYESFHKGHPTVPITSSEDTSSYMTRGVYDENDKLCMAGNSDVKGAPWGATHRNAWEVIASKPYVAGGFVWTGFDYRGEPQKYSWPSVSSVFGIMDVCGFPKAAYYMHQAAWIDDKPILHLFPHWNFTGFEGEVIHVMAMSNLDTVELFLNGKSLGEKKIDRLQGGMWDVPFVPGKLEAIGKKDGKEVARFSEETTGSPVSLKLTLDRPSLDGNGADAEPITVSAIDDQGRDVPTANLPVTFALSGPGTIIGTGNGDNTSHEPEQTNQRSLFNGLAQVIVRSQRDSSGPLTLVAKADGLKSAQVVMNVRAVPPIPFVPSTSPIFTLTKWRMSPISSVKPDPNVQIGDTDMNSWSTIQPGTAQKFEGGTWETYRTTFTPVASVQKLGGTILFKQISGTAEIWCDGKMLTQKTEPNPGELSVPLPADPAPDRTITVLIHSADAPKAGLSGLVIVQP